MENIVENDRFDVCLEPWDWRYAAAIVGLSKYLMYYGEKGEDYEVSDDCLKFRSTDITEEKYLQFAEAELAEELWHTQLERILKREEFTEDTIKYANEVMKSNSIMKKVFGKSKFDGNNSEELLELIEVHRKELIRETFRNKANMYANFANTGQLFEGEKACCRLLGYYVDGGRKTKSISYNFDTSTFVSKDTPYFDFIPFAFYGDREVFFINDNYSVIQLINTNRNFEERVRAEIIRSEGRSKDAKKVFFKSIQETADFIDYDIEVIVKNREMPFFETMYVRKRSIQILRKIKVYDPFCFSIKISDNYYISIENEVMDSILNLVRTDEVIELMLKQNRETMRNNSEYIVSLLIHINRLICGGGKEMEQNMKVAYACAKEVAKKLPDNKRESYRQKLTSAIVFKDYDRYCQVLLQLSNYADVDFSFAYDLFANFEENKDVAYTFINALTMRKIDSETANN